MGHWGIGILGIGVLGNGVPVGCTYGLNMWSNIFGHAVSFKQVMQADGLQTSRQLKLESCKTILGLALGVICQTQAWARFH